MSASLPWWEVIPPGTEPLTDRQMKLLSLVLPAAPGDEVMVNRGWIEGLMARLAKAEQTPPAPPGTRGGDEPTTDDRPTREET